MSVLRTRVNGTLVEIRREGRGNFVATCPDFRNVSTYESAQIFVAGNIAMFDALAKGSDSSATMAIEDLGFMSATVVEMTQWRDAYLSN